MPRLDTYGELALRGNAFAAREALRLLQEALRRHPDDPEVLTRLGYLYQMKVTWSAQRPSTIAR
jgi:Flp pilus assembly protein TadD